MASAISGFVIPFDANSAVRRSRGGNCANRAAEETLPHTVRTRNTSNRFPL